jgi:hypothetical protein
MRPLSSLTFAAAALISGSAAAALANLPRPEPARAWHDEAGSFYYIVEEQPPAPAQPLPAAPLPTAPVPDATTPPVTPPATDDSAAPTDDEAAPADEPSLGEVEEVKVVDLTEDSARRAVDAYVLLKEKYKDAHLENYETLQEFVDKDSQGKAFEADVKAAGFPNVEEWNTTITTASNAYSNIVNDQSADVNQQIEDVGKDTELAQDMKDRLINSLKALIPTENNRKVVQALLDDPAYTEKLKQLETEDE